MAGRMFDAVPLAHTAVRFMVIMNQTGEAAGIAAYYALNEGIRFDKLNAITKRETLKKGDSIVI